MAVATVQIRRQISKPGHSARNRGSCSSISGIWTSRKQGQRRQSGQQMAYAVNQRGQTQRAIGSSSVRQTCLFRGRLAVGNAFVAPDRARRVRSVIALGLIKRNGRVKALRIPALCRASDMRRIQALTREGPFPFTFIWPKAAAASTLSGQHSSPCGTQKQAFFAPDSIAAKPLKPCDGGIFRGL